MRPEWAVEVTILRKEWYVSAPSIEPSGTGSWERDH